MTKRILFLALLTALLLCGCSVQTVDEMYAIPKRSDDYNNLQSAIDGAMTNLPEKTGNRCKWQIWMATASKNIWCLPKARKIGR